ncbi:MAG: hypothetical protein JO288_19515 [Hyphomicrobiales bacterium]|nr:hypothetical protein [Hyphomicrobiales bacterium]
MVSWLTYSIAREFLEGAIGKENFSLRAWAGGGRGRTGIGAQRDSGSYDVFRQTKHSKGIHGGPLPPGLYICRYVAHHHHFGECIFLEQTPTALFQIDMKANVRFYDRDGFYIHGRGPHGSDGCIVPESNPERIRLNKAVKDATSAVLLKVTDVGMALPAARYTGTMA